MAKLSMIARERKREETVRRYSARRKQLRAILRNPRSDFEEREEARRKLRQLPRDASPVRLQRRCQMTGRPHAVYRKFGLSRNKLREAAMRGDVPGLVKASW
jgi:small subunit ribosomal protein S14